MAEDAGAELTPGTDGSMGDPALAQMASRVVRTFSWSATSLQADCTQGVSLGVSSATLPQEHLKSVSPHPTSWTPLDRHE